jgi:hypothetical protein
MVGMMLDDLFFHHSWLINQEWKISTTGEDCPMTFIGKNMFLCF